jgi:hypothetical protein
MQGIRFQSSAVDTRDIIARAEAEQVLSWKAVADRYLELYERHR